MKKAGWIAAGALGGLAGAVAAQTYLRYQRETRAAVARLRAGSEVIETACGPVEYAVYGRVAGFLKEQEAVKA